MLDITGRQRESYLRSGKVNWLIFVPGLCVATLVSMIVAICLYIAFEMGFYLIVIAPAIAGLIGAGAWWLVLKWSHCRNRFLAIAGAVWLGLIIYVGYFQFGMAVQFGPEFLFSVDELPNYILFRMQNDVIRDAKDFGPGPANGPDAFQQGMNWFAFVMEQVFVIGMLVGLGASRATKAYCESCRKWMQPETVNLSVGSGTAIWDCLCQGNAAEAQRHLVSTAPAQPGGCSVIVEHCTKCRAQGGGSQIYLTVTDLPNPTSPEVATTNFKSVSVAPTAKRARVRKFVDQVALLPNEVVTLGTAFPSLKQTINTAPELAAAAKVEAAETERQAAAQVQEWPHEYAHIEVLTGPTARVILTTKNAVLQTIIGIVTIFGGFGLAFLPAGILYGLIAKPPDWLLGVAIVWLFACLILNLIWIMFYGTFFTTRFMRWCSRRAFASRADSAVDWQDPDLVFVDIIPRQNWGKVMLENASDIGFVEVNLQRREIIFEGDKERYWIPAESILEVKHEFFAESTQHQLQSAPSLNHLIVVRAMTEKGPWETWFYRRHTSWRPRTEKRRLIDALELEGRICDSLQGSSPAAPPDI